MTLTGDGTTTLFVLPSDFERILQGQALWSNKYPSIPLQGPITSQDLLALKALPVMPVRPVWRLIGGQLEIWPALSILKSSTANIGRPTRLSLTA
jgi:hypothetical protein